MTIFSRRLQVSKQMGPSPSSVGTPIAPAKLPSEPPRETTGWMGAPISVAKRSANLYNGWLEVSGNTGRVQPPSMRTLTLGSPVSARSFLTSFSSADTS